MIVFSSIIAFQINTQTVVLTAFKLILFLYYKLYLFSLYITNFTNLHFAAIELGQERYDETSASGEWPNEDLYAEYALHLQFLKKDLSEAARIYRAGMGRYGDSR